MYRIQVFGAILLSIFCAFIIGSSPSFTLNGKSVITIPLNSTYQELGAQLTLPFTNSSTEVQIEQDIDTSKVGVYHVNYVVKNKNHIYKQTRIVKVEDQEVPTIILDGDSNVLLCPNEQYIEQGYHASDSYDGEITDKVKIQILPNKIVYKVEDSSHNLFTIARALIREDQEAPLIELIGDEIFTLYLGENWQEPGYQAIDNCDGDISKNVQVTGNVNSNVLGTYEIKYLVQDSSKKETIATRTIRVAPKPDNSGKTIYLTFDDGPSRSTTPQILQILKEENVKATFFVINHDASLDYLIHEEANMGHTVAIHSYTHNYRQIYASENAYLNDLNLISNKIERITGIHPTIIRFPGGSSNTVSRFNPGVMTRLTKLVMQKGYLYFDWNIDSGDAGDAKTSSRVYQNVTSGFGSKNNVVLMHDFENNKATLGALRDIIHYGKRMGYIFSAITQSTPQIRHSVNN